MHRHAGVGYQNLGVYHYRAGDYTQAETLFLRAIMVRPEYPMAYFSLGNILFIQDDFDEAIQAYQIAIKLKPDYADAYRNLGGVLAKQSRFAEARGMLEKAASLNSNLGALYYKQGRYVEAIAALKQAVRLGPEDARVEQILAEATQKAGLKIQKKKMGDLSGDGEERLALMR